MNSSQKDDDDDDDDNNNNNNNFNNNNNNCEQRNVADSTKIPSYDHLRKSPAH
jgi:hypothetical protein